MRNNLFHTLALSSSISLLLLIFRMEWSDNTYYVFLVWNLFLAWIPYLFAKKLPAQHKGESMQWQHLCLFGAWLLFFPNCPYLITDIFHFKLRAPIPLWFDLVLVFSFVWNGLLLGFVSLLNVQTFLKNHLSQAQLTIVIIGLIILSSFGIYLGRYPRWNSWDVFTQPAALFKDIFEYVRHPFHHIHMIGVTFFFSVFLMIGHYTLNTLIKSQNNEQS